MYTYAFLKTPESPLKLPQGVANQVLMIEGNSISAIVEPGISLESFQSNDEKVIQMVLSHDCVICELFRQITVLPLRFGTYFASQENLLNHIESCEQEYEDKLVKITGKTEFILKLIPRIFEEVVPSSGIGRDYFLAKKQHYQNQTNFNLGQTKEKENLINLIIKIHQLPMIMQEQESELRCYILVNNRDKDLLLKEFLNWQKACPRWNLSLGEGLPPYHFI